MVPLTSAFSMKVIFLCKGKGAGFSLGLYFPFFPVNAQQESELADIPFDSFDHNYSILSHPLADFC